MNEFWIVQLSRELLNVNCSNKTICWEPIPEIQQWIKSKPQSRVVFDAYHGQLLFSDKNDVLEYKLRFSGLCINY